MMTRPLSPREREVYALIVAAADAGKPCPTNTQIMDATGIRLTQSVNDYLNRITAKGWLTMQRYQASRVATVTETGRQTLRLPDRPHWRDIPGHKAASTMTQRKRALSARDGIVSAGAVGRDPVPESPPVDRDPCFKCGVRGDIGCRHRRASA